MATTILDKSDAPTRDTASDMEAWFAAANRRTPEEIAAVRKIVFSHIPHPLPHGKTLEDVFVGALPDDKSEGEVIAALADLG